MASLSSKKRNKNSWLTSLGIKFILPTIFLLTITLGGTSIYTYNVDKKSAYASLNEKINTLTQFAVQISPNEILSFNFDSLNTYMESLTKSEDIVYAAIVSPEGDAMTSYLDLLSPYIITLQVDETNHLEQDILLIIKKINLRPEIIHRSYPIIFEDNELGRILIGFSNTRIEKETQNLLYQQLSASLISILLLCGFIYSVFRVSTLRPITQLIDSSVRISNGDLDTKVDVCSSDEFGDLANYFNEMVKNLKQSVEDKDTVLVQLTDLNKNLESRVEHRTAELVEVNKELEHLALHDTLTGLPNRTVIQDSLKKNIRSSELKNQKFCVFMMDLDRFKEVNDTLGHDVGDSLLIAVSKRLINSLRDTDIIGRLGGDEFAIILPTTNIEAAVFVANKIRKEIEPAFFINAHALSISMSIGISSYPQHGNDASTLMKSADVAMYHSKNNKIDHCVYHDSLIRKSPDQLNLMGELRDAIKNEDLCLYYQPKIDTKSQKIIGVEALVRWQHSFRGLVFPDDFIPLAEQTGLIRPLTRLVLKLAMQQSANWNKQNIQVTMAINLSMHDVQDENFPELLLELMAQTEAKAEQIVLEITESSIMSNPVSVMSVLDRIAAMGVRLSIDDFGTGYSSLSNLKKMPVNELKIDRSFVMDMVEDKDDFAIVESTIHLAHAMGLKVVAEGVETNEISKKLAALDCDMMQGYYFSKPMPANEITTMLTDDLPSKNR